MLSRARGGQAGSNQENGQCDEKIKGSKQGDKTRVAEHNNKRDARAHALISHRLNGLVEYTVPVLRQAWAFLLWS